MYNDIGTRNAQRKKEIDKMREREISGKKIGKVITIMSGKGGVGKTSATGLIACALRKQNYRVGILDADIAVPNIPFIFGLDNIKLDQNKKTLEPFETRTGIKVMSSAFLKNQEEDLSILQCQTLIKEVSRYFYDTNWGELDYLIIDLPPGRSGAGLEITKTLPVDGTVVISMPQKLVKNVVKKSIERTQKLDIEIYGVIENMSYFDCYDCGKNSYVYGKSKREDVESFFGIPFITRLPLDPRFSELIDQGRIEHFADIHIDFINRFALNLNKKF